DQEMSKVFIGGDECPSRLSPTEFKLLEFLYSAGGRLCTRDEISYALLERPEYGVISDEAFDSLVSRLRRKIERYPKRPVYLITERGMGYRLENIAWPIKVR
ncbi:MAG: winged helix-turn-helix domain-containing protein, partial [Chloroflexi bacterium]|nr:winged helix-turn-helix domain-containing protein [Chloroflexota bacterium]